MEIDLEVLKKKIAAATPLPWHWNGDFEEAVGEEGTRHWLLDTPDMNHIGYIEMKGASYAEGQRNIEMLVSAVNAVPDLIKELEELREWKAATQRLQDREWYGDLTPEEVAAEDAHWAKVFAESKVPYDEARYYGENEHDDDE